MEAGISYEHGATNPKVMKANLGDYLFHKFVNSWTDDISRDNARQGTGRNKLRTYTGRLKVYIKPKIILTVLCPNVTEVRMPSFDVELRRFVSKQADMNVYPRSSDFALIVPIQSKMKNTYFLDALRIVVKEK